jgi:single-strand DNA-binding protein
MANLNKVLLMGNITRDPQLTYLPGNQTAVVEIGLAVNRTWTGADGQKKEEVTFVDCSAFGKQAEVLAKYKKKGDPLFIEGRLKLDTWEKDGQKRSKMRVVIENFQFLNRSAGPQQFDAGEDAAPAQSAPRQAYRPQGRPAAQPARPAPQHDVEPPHPEDDAPPPIKDDDIPF